MTVGSSSSIETRVSLSKSKFSKFKASLPFFKKTPQVQDDIKTEEVLLTFQQNLQLCHFAVAGKQLICREEQLFALKQEGIGSSKSLLEEEEEDEDEKLKKDFEDLLKNVMSTIEKSFDVQSDEEREILKEAVLAIDQEEEQDIRWEGVEKNKRPPWRPRCCRLDHDSRLQHIVTQRMEDTKIDSNVTTLQSSVHLKITAKANQLKQDLLNIARNVRSCYPEKNVCQMYAEIYHQVFSNELREIADFELLDDDCKHLLLWVNHYYPEILRHEELSGVVDYEHFKPLLPGDILGKLEEMFLISKENELQAWCQTLLKREKSAHPILMDNCYLTHLTTDVIQCVDGLLTSSKVVLGSRSKTQRITLKLKKFLTDYQIFLEEVIRNNQVKAEAVLKANLSCIRELRNYIMMNPDLFPPHIRNDYIDLLTRLRDTCHSYFTKLIHKALKGTYSKLGTKQWIKHNESVCSELLEGVEKQIQEIRNLHEACFKELISKLHEEVLATYVRKMMRKKTKLKDEKKQHQAVEALCKNSQKIHTLFTEAGSDRNDLKDILPKLAELLTLKDPHSIDLQLVDLSYTYLDFSEAHASAWLYLRADLSFSVLKEIKKTFAACHAQTVDDPDLLHSSRNFFSNIAI